MTCQKKKVISRHKNVKISQTLSWLSMWIHALLCIWVYSPHCGPQNGYSHSSRLSWQVGYLESANETQKNLLCVVHYVGTGVIENDSPKLIYIGHPSLDILIKFQISWKFPLLKFREDWYDHNEILHKSRQLSSVQRDATPVHRQ